MPPWLILSIIRYGSRVKWSNPGKGVAPSHSHWCSSHRKGSLQAPSTTVANFTSFYSWFEFCVFILLDWLSGKGYKTQSYNLPIAGWGTMNTFSSRSLGLIETQPVLFWIWTLVIYSISYDDTQKALSVVICRASSLPVGNDTVVLCLSWYFIETLVPWLPHAFPGSLFINSICAHVVFERSTNGDDIIYPELLTVEVVRWSKLVGCW